MDVGCELSGHVVVDDGLDSLDVETSTGEIGREEVLDLAVLEVVECLQTLSTGAEKGWSDFLRFDETEGT